ncbi:hypothetical protein [Flavivirga eckloniae]|uniref:Lipocalin-like domain-containing protein n=1 Tax=Flavivirga eckloniae TaxID=1803846 RepID=A0A2K9PUC4_9FLAO|nr:hypothetical protein [Flavivirga eckloniae]AUP80670.1 hypothetical protein C1H87_18910 [Flavivirga eckloniae]
MKAKILLIIGLLIITFACDNSNDFIEPPVKQAEMISLHSEKDWNETKIMNTLIGQWEWEYVSCFWDSEDSRYAKKQELTIEFKTDGSLEIQQNGKPTQNSEWKVVLNSNIYELEVSPPVEQLYGNIFFSERRVLFYQSYMDICDNYFKRK